MTQSTGYGPQWPTPPAPPQPPKKEAKRVHWAGVIVIGFFCFVFGIGCGATTSGSTPAAQSSPSTSAPRPTYTAPTYSPPVTVAPAAPTTSFGDGTWIVGSDIQPGTYRSSGAKQGLFELCSATTKSGASSNSDTIDWVTANANEPVVIEIGPGVKAFEVSGCEPFTKTD